MTSKDNIDMQLMMLNPLYTLNKMYASFQKLSVGTQKCDNADDGDMLPMCRSCFAGDIIRHKEGLKTRGF